MIDWIIIGFRAADPFEVRIPNKLLLPRHMAPMALPAVVEVTRSPSALPVIFSNIAV